MREVAGSTPGGYVCKLQLCHEHLLISFRKTYISVISECRVLETNVLLQYHLPKLKLTTMYKTILNKFIWQLTLKWLNLMMILLARIESCHN
jgi:hypothetical protein